MPVHHVPELPLRRALTGRSLESRNLVRVVVNSHSSLIILITNPNHSRNAPRDRNQVYKPFITSAVLLGSSPVLRHPNAWANSKPPGIQVHVSSLSNTPEPFSLPGLVCNAGKLPVVVGAHTSIYASYRMRENGGRAKIRQENEEILEKRDKLLMNQTQKLLARN